MRIPVISPGNRAANQQEANDRRGDKPIMVAFESMPTISRCGQPPWPFPRQIAEALFSSPAANCCPSGCRSLNLGEKSWRFHELNTPPDRKSFRFLLRPSGGPLLDVNLGGAAAFV